MSVVIYTVEASADGALVTGTCVLMSGLASGVDDGGAEGFSVCPVGTVLLLPGVPLQPDSKVTANIEMSIMVRKRFIKFLLAWIPVS